MRKLKASSPIILLLKNQNVFLDILDIKKEMFKITKIKNA